MRNIREHVHTELAQLAAKNHTAQELARQERHAVDPGAELSQQLSVPPAPEDGEGAPQQTLTVSDGMIEKLDEVVRRDDIRVLKLEIEELKDRSICMRAFHHLKCQAMRHKFEDQMQALRMTLGSNSELWDRLVQVSQRENKAEKGFTETARETWLAESHIEQLRGQVEVSTESREKLQSWRR